mgnify:FL=1
MGLKHTEGRVVARVNREKKNYYTFADGTKIRVERQFDNFNRRETQPTNAIVVSAKGIPEGAEILVHPNAPEENNRIYDYTPLSGEEVASHVKYYSIPEDQCFAWRNENQWKPIPPFETALRVFKPYKGLLTGVEPTQLKDVLFVTSGELKGKVVKTIKSSDYCIVFQDTNGKEGNLIRFRPFGCQKTKREEEAVAILWDETKLVNRGDLLVGLSKSDAKQLKETSDARNR